MADVETRRAQRRAFLSLKRTTEQIPGLDFVQLNGPAAINLFNEFGVKISKSYRTLLLIQGVSISPTDLGECQHKFKERLANTAYDWFRLEVM